MRLVMQPVAGSIWTPGGAINNVVIGNLLDFGSIEVEESVSDVVPPMNMTMDRVLGDNIIAAGNGIHLLRATDWNGGSIDAPSVGSMVITGDHDTRVMPMHSFKFAAALQAAQGGDAPVLLAVDLSSGHGGGETVTQAITQSADIYTFLAENLHMLGDSH